MKRGASSETSDGALKTQRGVVKWVYKSIVALLVEAALLMISVGRWNWFRGWLLVGLYAAATVVQFLVMPPDLLAERSGIGKGAKTWDIALGGLAASILPMTTWVVAGLDARDGWSPPIASALWWFGLLLFVLGWCIALWAMHVNCYFSTLVRLQEERGQRVVTEGPYRQVRHPGYVGAILFQLATPVILGSWWAMIPSGLAAALYVVRTALEDETLHQELAGYKAYAREVRYRLVPGVW
ncbi:MAG: isoprenylcysteine carboxylmethyltransferase family protein [Chloroflexota bacterium]|nr:isoprenylcysteine carboxylmethyltransferase family protein [Chloroflexota bacterium]